MAQVFINDKHGTEIVIFYIIVVLLVHDPLAFLVHSAIKISATLLFVIAFSTSTSSLVSDRKLDPALSPAILLIQGERI